VDAGAATAANGTTTAKTIACSERNRIRC